MHDHVATTGTITDEADVIVVGAGPGGSATAYHMARHGLRVLLLERHIVDSLLCRQHLPCKPCNSPPDNIPIAVTSR